MLFAFLSSYGFADEEYVFERMWPILQQPWYFVPKDIAIDPAGNVYVADRQNHRIQKFSASGGFITKWGDHGDGNGQFSYPEGIAVDPQGNVYVADTGNSRIQKFNASGGFITKWGDHGDGNGQFYHPEGIAVDLQGSVYVTDSWNHRIQKFSASGGFITKWGDHGDGNGQFSYPEGIAIDPQGHVYVADTSNSRIQKFNASGGFITKWGNEGIGDGQFYLPSGIAVDPERNELYVADAQNDRIQKFGTSGEFITKWASGGNSDGQFLNANQIAINPQGNIYVADSFNHRIQKFSASGEFITKWGSKGAGNGQFYCPYGIAIDTEGSVYVTDSWNHRIQKFSASGGFITKWGSEGAGNGQFSTPLGIAVDPQGNVYVADSGNNRIQKFNASGGFITKWGNNGTSPRGIAVDAVGSIYVLDWSRIQKFTSSGEFITKWGDKGDGNGQFHYPDAIAAGPQGNIYVADSRNDRVQMFSAAGQFVGKICESGSEPGLLRDPSGIVASGDGKIYIVDSDNHRIQVFKNSTTAFNSKAIIVSGSGPYDTNTLWDATEMCASYAYRALIFQGYTRDTIYYLSADTDLDLDNDGYPDVDADATNANLEYAIKTWAAYADNLFIYLVGHGGEGTFRMGEYELLEASLLDTWLDAAQQSISDFVTLVYDGCHSGSFVSYLAPPNGKTRIIAVSTSPNEPAIFEVDGGLSFGYQFFSQLFNGNNFYKSYLHAKNCVKTTYDDKQNPVLEANANGVGNEKADEDIANSIKIGNETKTAGDIPSIQDVSAPQTLPMGETSAFIQAKNVVDADGIQEVFAMVKPPNYSSGSPDNPVTDLPNISLISVGNDDYSGSYEGFTSEGVYNVAIFARDRKGILSLPYQTSVTVPGDTDCLAVGAGIGINVPCADYNGNLYGFTLDFYHNPDDASGFYWKLVMPTLTTGTGLYCVPIGTDLSMPMDCVSYNGTQYGFNLKFYPNPYDPYGLYWVMDKSTLNVK